MRHLLLSVFLFAAAEVAAAPSGITVSQGLDKTQMAYEDSAIFKVILEWPGPQYAYLFDRPLEPTLQGLKVASFSSSISTTGSGPDESTTKVYRFKLAPTASGEDRVEAIHISYIAYPDSIPGELVTEPVAIQVAPAVPVAKGGTLSWLWIVLVFGVLILAAVVAWFYLRAARRKEASKVVLSPSQLALEQLAETHRESAGDFKKFQSGLYKILVSFLAAGFGIDADALDDDGLGEAIEATSLPEAAKQRITTWLITARKDKFRPVEAPPGEAIRLESEVRGLFEKL